LVQGGQRCRPLIAPQLRSDPTAMDASNPVTRDLHLQELRSFHAAVVSALAEAGVGGARLGEVLGSAVRADCAQCGISVTGEEIAAALAAESAHAAANPRHARLLQNYCARAGCPSYFYRFAFSPVPGIDWGQCLARADELARGRNQEAAESSRAEEQAQRRIQQRKVLRIFGVIAALVALWAARQWWTTGSLPGVKAAPKYMIDPSSVGAAPRTNPAVYPIR
jgi:hypothetical protein